MNKMFSENVFDKITTENAYFLGLLFADGCVSKTTHGRHIISFSSEDIDLMNSVCCFFESENKVRVELAKNGKKYFHLGLCSKYLFDRMEKLGCVERKSLIVGPPLISKKYFLPFLMGLFDGDGSISRNKSINSWKASLGTASKKMFTWIVDLLKNFGITFNEEIRDIESGKFYIICFTGISARAFLDIIYGSVKNIENTLKRKRELYYNIKKIKFRKGPNLFDWEKEYMKMEISDEDCSKRITKDKRNYGWTRSADSIRHLRKNYGIKIKG